MSCTPRDVSLAGCFILWLQKPCLLTRIEAIPENSMIPSVTSPRWSSTTKLLVGLVIIGIITFLLYRFTSLLPPLLMVFVLVYVLHPVAGAISSGLGISWRAAVNI